jgi:hypothetical protein
VPALATADFQPDLTEVDVEFVVDDEDVRGRHRIKLGQWPHLAAGFIHVAARLGQYHGASTEPTGNDLSSGPLVHLEV